MRRTHEFAHTLNSVEKRRDLSINTHLQILKCTAQNVKGQNMGKLCPYKNNLIALKSNKKWVI